MPLYSSSDEKKWTVEGLASASDAAILLFFVSLVA
jgi:hypothetical protein